MFTRYPPSKTTLLQCCDKIVRLLQHCYDVYIALTRRYILHSQMISTKPTLGPTIVASILKNKQPQIHLCKSMAMNMCFFDELLCFELENRRLNYLNVKLRYLAGLPRHKCFGNGQFNPVTDYTTCPKSLFQAYEFAMHFRRHRQR